MVVRCWCWVYERKGGGCIYVIHWKTNSYHLLIWKINRLGWSRRIVIKEFTIVDILFTYFTSHGLNCLTKRQAQRKHTKFTNSTGEYMRWKRLDRDIEEMRKRRGNKDEQFRCTFNYCNLVQILEESCY